MVNHISSNSATLAILALSASVAMVSIGFKNVYVGARNGVFYGKNKVEYRESRVAAPFGFWMNIAFQSFPIWLGIWLAYWGIRQFII